MSVRERIPNGCSLLALLSLWTLACGDGGSPEGLDRYFDPAPSYTADACQNRDDRLAGHREVRLFFNGTADVEGITRGLARYYQRHGLTFFTASEAQAVATQFAIDTDTEALGRELTRAFPGVDFTNDAAVMADPVLWQQVLDATVNFLLRPMIDFARAHGTVGPAATNLVVVSQIERPGGERLTPVGQEIAGMAVSPTLLSVFARDDTSEGQIWKGVALPDGFTPMMFLGQDVLRRLAATHSDLRDIVVAHEFGHTNALVHRSASHNLMNPAVAPGQNDCRDSLADDQIATVQMNLGLASGGQALLAEPAHNTEINLGEPKELAVSHAFTPGDLRNLLRGDGGARRRLLTALHLVN